MKKTNRFNPYGLEEKQKRFKQIMHLSTWGCALLGSLVFFPISLMLAANGADSLWKYVVYYLSEILSVGGLFALLALLVVAVAHEDDSLRRKALRWEIGATIVLSFALRIFVYWFTAFLDKKLMIDFYFNDKTLAHLVHGGALTSYIFSSLFNLPVLLFVILLSLRLVRANYRASQRGMASGMMKKIPVVVYLAVAVIFAVIETILTINDLGIAASMNVLTTLLMPYIEIALFTLLGSYLLTYLVEWFDQKENA